MSQALRRQMATTPSARNWPGVAIAVLTRLAPHAATAKSFPAAECKSDGVGARALSTLDTRDGDGDGQAHARPRSRQ
jgi:hypothetical protein